MSLKQDYFFLKSSLIQFFLHVLKNLREIKFQMFYFLGGGLLTHVFLHELFSWGKIRLDTKFHSPPYYRSKIILVIVPGEKQSQPSLPLDGFGLNLDRSWIGLWLEFDNNYIITCDNLLSLLLTSYLFWSPSTIFPNHCDKCVSIDIQNIPLAQLINNKPPLITSFESDKCKIIDNNQIIRIRCQISHFEESLNKNLLSLIISFVADQCQCIENNNLWLSSLIISFVADQCEWMYWQ